MEVSCWSWSEQKRCLAHAAERAAKPHARASGGRHGGRGRGRRAADDNRHEPLAEATDAADDLYPAPGGTAAQRRVAAAEDGMRLGLASLDEVCLEETFRCRILTLQGVPARLRRALRTALRTGLELIFRSERRRNKSSEVGNSSSWLRLCSSTVPQAIRASPPGPGAALRGFCAWGVVDPPPRRYGPTCRGRCPLRSPR